MLFTGILLVLISGRALYKHNILWRLSNNEKEETRDVETLLPEEGVEERLRILQDEIVFLRTKIESMDKEKRTPQERSFDHYLEGALEGESTAENQRESGVRDHIKTAVKKEKPAAGKARRAGPRKDRQGDLPADPRNAMTMQEQIREAYTGGESIEDLARRFQRGKGEISLIVNLRR